MDSSYIMEIIERDPSLADLLYARGFLFTNARIPYADHPILARWARERIGEYTLFTDPRQGHAVYGGLALVGHAYDPFFGTADERLILADLDRLGFGTEGFWERFNGLTGVFVLFCAAEEGLYLTGDASCMQSAFYCTDSGKMYAAGHTNLLRDILGLKWSDYAAELCGYRYFGLMGKSLPGDMTQFDTVKRLVPNHFVFFDRAGNAPVCRRFFTPRDLALSVGDAAERASAILKNNIGLISEKWPRAAISTTGGCDSKTTLSCAREFSDRFSYYSFSTTESERIDAEAAHAICGALGLEHRIYSVSGDDSDFEDIEDIRAILRWNSGDLTADKPNDVRKRAYFLGVHDFDIEVKSWASEIGRAYYSKRFGGRKDFGRPTPRKCTTLYKFFLNNRKLVRKTDEVFADYLERFFVQDKDAPLPWQEQFFWEFRVPSWNGLGISCQQRLSHDITIPYNNRRLLELLLSVPIEDRINDSVYAEIRRRMDPRIDATGISVTNVKHTKKRAIAEAVYYAIHSRIRF